MELGESHLKIPVVFQENELKIESVRNKVKNELKIPGCDYWGMYDGYKIYKCYSKTAPNYDNIIFAIGTNLYMNGEIVGKVDNAGRVSCWDPERGIKNKKKFELFVPEERAPESQNKVVSSAEELLELALKRNIEDLVGPSLASW